MAQISTADFKNGITLDLPEGLVQLVEFQHVKPGKGGAFVRTTLKNVRTGAVLDRTFRAGEKMERAFVEKKEMQYLYNDGNDYVFMDSNTYEQLSVSPASLGDAKDYLLENMTAQVQMFGDEIIGVELPTSVDIPIAETEPGLQGDRSSAGRKPAKLITGLVVQVPLFVGPDDVIRVDTRTGEYLTRANS
ncbi:MAG: elongation factor P [Actinobacteria bacterium]|nr:elongation factor P [Actinomycetota bacterium]